MVSCKIPRFTRRITCRGIEPVALLVAILLSTSPFLTSTAQADHTPEPSTITVAGNLQDELGCPGDWQPDCSSTHLSLDAGNELWQAVFTLPAGTWEYKAALNDSWDENYGANAAPNGPNIVLSLAAETAVKFYYDHESHWITDDVNSIIATAVGNFQSALGCSGDWQPNCLQSWLQDPDGDGVYEFSTVDIPAGSYECKVALNESWDESYPASNLPFTVTSGDQVTFLYDSATNAVEVQVSGPPPSGPMSVTVAGNMQSELGCPGDWQPDCSVTHLTMGTEDDVWRGTFEIPAGAWEYKAAMDDSWLENYGANAQPNGTNIPFSLGTAAEVTFYYDDTSHWITDDVNSVIAAVVGSFQSELGCSGDWQPWCLQSWLQDPDGDGVYSFSTTDIPAGTYECKVAHDESWDESYPADNVFFTIADDGAQVLFTYDPSTHDLWIWVDGTPIQVETETWGRVKARFGN